MMKEIHKRIKFTEMEKKFMIQLLSVFDENKDSMYYEIDTDEEAKEAYDSLKIACEYPEETEMDEKAVENCLKILGS